MTETGAETVTMQIDPSAAIVDRGMAFSPGYRAKSPSGFIELIGEPGFVPALILLPVGLVAVGVWRAAMAIGGAFGGKPRQRPALHPAFEDLIGRAMPVCPGADVGDNLLAGGGAGLDRGRAHVREQHHV